ncbi:MAG: hypothetical protein FJ315_06585 [SAR202 cluster bacterium]|nr:hypothetical protein [SAR202 cluster bacterium]
MRNSNRNGNGLETPDRRVREAREYLLTASNALFLYRSRCEEERLAVPERVIAAHAAIHAELKQLEDELAASRPPRQDRTALQTTLPW